MVLGFDFHGHRQVELDRLGLGQIASLFSTYSGLVVDSPGRTGKSPEEVLAALKELAETRKWRTAQQSHTFGYGAVPSVHQPPPGPFQEHYSFLPFAPQLHGLPFFQPPPGHTAEWLGQDLMVRHRSPEDLQSLRDQSGAYRDPAQNPSAPDQPRYPPEVYGEHQSTVVDRDRVLDWSTEKRDGKTPARHGPAVGHPWPDQGRVMGSSAQEAVMAAAREGARDLDTRRSYDWLHLYAFSIGGLDRQNPQVPQNLVVGSQQANFYHLIFESVVKELANDHRLTVLVRVTPSDPISPRWHIYRRLVYSLSIVVRVPGSFAHPEGMLVAQRTITRVIDCLGLPPVHANDAETIRHSLLAELGIVTPEYRGAVERALPLGSDRERPSPGPKQLPRFMHHEREARMVDQLLHQNNCLINAVARGLVNRNATFEELVTIRGMMIDRGIELGQMLFASPAVLEIIRRVFFSGRGIRVVYRNGQPDDVVNGPDPIIIDHEWLHFELRK